MLGFSRILNGFCRFGPKIYQYICSSKHSGPHRVFSPSFQAMKGAVFKNNQPKEDVNLANTEELTVGPLPNSLSNAL